MFYSHQILAKKGPLATVWIAAHLQHRLKKSQYTATDIVSAVDRIMLPDAPIALRLSSHLLLGVVRIYAKKVEYLYHDYIVLQTGIEKISSHRNVDLSEAAANPPPESVTLPVFQLDALDVDDDFGHEGEQDRFRMNPDMITLPGEVTIERNTYVAITFDEDDMLIGQPTREISHSNERVSGQSPLEIPHSDDRVSGQDILRGIHVVGSVVSGDPAQTDHAEITSARLNVATDSDVRPMEEDMIPPPPVDTSGGLKNPSSSNQSLLKESSPQSFPNIEVMRDAAHDLQPENIPLWTELQNDFTKVQSPRGQVTTEQETPPPLLDNILVPGGQSSSFQNHLVQPTSANSTEDPGILGSRLSFGHASPELALRSTPPVEQPQPRARRKRFLIDETIVLTNQIMKGALNDAHDISRRRRPCPGSVLGDWKRRTRRKMEHIFDEPSVTSICPDLCNVFKKDFITANSHLLLSEEASSEQPRTSRSSASVPDIDIETEHPKAAGSSVPLPDPDIEIERQSPSRIPDLSTDMEIERLIRAQSPAADAELDMEIERLRQPENDGSNVFQEFMSSPAGFTGSPNRKDDLTPSNIVLDNQGEGEATFGTSSFPTGNMTSTSHFGSEMETPNTYEDERLGVENNSLFDIPELMNSAQTEDLNFLEVDSSPTSSQQTQRRDALSARTRAVEQFLKGHSPATQIRDDLTDEISLNKVLQGKTRKICARMFYETLVLKSHRRIDVHQEEPYGDIHLKLTQLKAQC